MNAIIKVIMPYIRSAIALIVPELIRYAASKIVSILKKKNKEAEQEK